MQQVTLLVESGDKRRIKAINDKTAAVGVQLCITDTATYGTSGASCIVYPSTDHRHFKYSIKHNKYSVWVMAWVHTSWVLCMVYACTVGFLYTRSTHTPWPLSVWSMHAPWVFSIHGLRIHHGYSLYGLRIHHGGTLCTRSMPHTPWVLSVHGLCIHHEYSLYAYTHHGHSVQSMDNTTYTLCDLWISSQMIGTFCA